MHETGNPPNSAPKRHIKVISIALGSFAAGIVVGMFIAGSGSGASASLQPNQQVPSPGMAAETAKRIRQLQQVLTADSMQAGVWTELGNLYFDTEQSLQAIDAYTHALRISPDNADVLTDLGIMYRSQKMFRQAVESFDKALAVDPAHRMARYNKGVVLLYDLGDHHGALVEWEKILEKDSTAVSADGQPISEIVSQLKMVSAANEPVK